MCGMMYNLTLTRQAVKDAQKLEQAGLKQKTIDLLRVIKNNPFQNPPPYEKLQGFENTYSRRINVQHRLVYQIHEPEKVVKIVRMWTHYE